MREMPERPKVENWELIILINSGPNKDQRQGILTMKRSNRVKEGIGEHSAEWGGQRKDEQMAPDSGFVQTAGQQNADQSESCGGLKKEK